MDKKSRLWGGIEVAYLVAKHGTLSKAAAEMEVHHSTVLRQIDAIEAGLGCKLFHRHARGYTPTEAGQILFEEAQHTEQRLERLVGKLAGQDKELSGSLLLTTVSTLSPVLMPVIRQFTQRHPQVQVELIADSRIFKLEYGEAHVSIRPGARPTDPDYVVQPLKTMQTTLYANSDYIKQHGTLNSLKNLKGHKFVNLTAELNNIDSIRWMNENVDKSQISFRGSDFNILADAAMNGLGIVPLSEDIARHKPGLIALLPPPKEWNNEVWLVTHRDIHRSPKVQAISQLLKQFFSQERP